MLYMIGFALSLPLSPSLFLSLSLSPSLCLSQCYTLRLGTKLWWKSSSRRKQTCFSLRLMVKPPCTTAPQVHTQPIKTAM